MPHRRWRGSLPPQHPAPNIWGSYPTAVLTDAPFSYYRLGDAANPPLVKDDSGFGHDIVSSITGNFGNSGAFSSDSNTSLLADGSTTNLFVAGAANTPVTTNGVSIECWVRSPNGGTFSNVRAAWAFGGTATNTNRIEVNGSCIVTSFLVFSGSQQSLAAPAPLSYNDWHQIVVTWNNSSTNWTLYIDGVQVAQTTHAGPVTTTQSGVQIAGDPDNPTHIFNGYVQDVSFYQSELSAARVLAHYQAGAITRNVPTGNFSITADGDFRFRLFNGRTSPTRGRVWNSPPVFQAAENTNGYFNRPVHSKWIRSNRAWQRRGKTINFITPPPVIQPNFVGNTSISAGGERRFLIFGPRRGRVWQPANIFQAYPPNPVWPNNKNQQLLRVGWRQGQKRGHIWQPANIFQAFPPNPIAPIDIFRQKQLVNRLPYTRRGRTWNAATIFQAFPPNPVAPINVDVQHRLYWLGLWRRRGVSVFPLAQAYPPNPVWPNTRNQQHEISAQRQWQRRGKIWWPTPTTIFPNPAIVFQVRQPNAYLVRRQWQRRGHNYMVWPQADPLTNGYWQPPAYHAFVNRAFRFWQRRGHIWLPPIFQAYPPNPVWPNTRNQQHELAILRQWQRRGKLWDASWFFNPVVIPNPNFVNQPQSRAYWARYFSRYLNRGTSGIDPVWQVPAPQLAPVDITRYKLSRVGLYIPRRGHVYSPHLDQAYPHNPDFGSNFNIRRGYPRNYPYARRGHLWVPILQQVIVNPNITEWQTRRNYRRWYEYVKRHRQWQPPIFQAYPPNPVFSNTWHIRGFGKLWWIGPRRGHVFNLPWPQSPLGFIPSIGTYILDEQVVSLYVIDDELVAVYWLNEGTV